MKKVVILFFIPLFALSFSINAQQKKTKKIEIINADELSFEKTQNKSLQRLIGNVIFEHEGAKMYCDSAYFYGKQNSMEAFGNVKIEMGDSVNMFCDYLKYDGTLKTVYARKNVKLFHKNSKLFTDSLDFYRKSGIAKYYTFGTIITEEDTLTSNYGYYQSRTRNFFPSGNVIVRNPRFIMHTDSLRFNTKRKTVYFLTKTDIKSDSARIICYSGHYNTIDDDALFGKNTFIQSKSKILKGDSLFYNAQKDYGEGYIYFLVIDTTNKMLASGKFGIYNGKANEIMTTDSAIMMIIDSNNDTLFLHSDTIVSKTDTNDNRMIFSYYNVRFYKTDLQGACDSLIYSMSDSTIYMYKKPILWSDNYQLFAKEINILSDRGGIKEVDMIDKGMITEKLDSIKYNQIKGKNIYAYFQNNNISHITVETNAETIYYPLNDKDQYIGMYKASSKNISISMNNNEVSRIVFYKNTNGVLYPIDQLPNDKLMLTGFKWMGKHRPHKKTDIFLKNNYSLFE